MYKVNIKNGKRLVFSRYFDKKKDAIAYRNLYNYNSKKIVFKATLQGKRVEMHYHHTATERGYVKKGYGWDDYYEGKFGVGFKRHIENNVTQPSNNYHFIDYYVEK